MVVGRIFFFSFLNCEPKTKNSLQCNFLSFLYSVFFSLYSFFRYAVFSSVAAVTKIVAATFSYTCKN